MQLKSKPDTEEFSLIGKFKGNNSKQKITVYLKASTKGNQRSCSFNNQCFHFKYVQKKNWKEKSDDSKAKNCVGWVKEKNQEQKKNSGNKKSKIKSKSSKERILTKKRITL